MSQSQITKKVISIIEYLSRDRIQLGVSQSEASILIGLLIGVQEVKILFLTFCCSIPGHMTHQYCKDSLGYV